MCDLIENELKWTIDDLYASFRSSTIASIVRVSPYNSGFDLLFEAYPNTLYPWKFKYTYKNFWASGDNVIWYVYHNVRMVGIGLNEFLSRWWRDMKLYRAARIYYSSDEMGELIKRAYSNEYSPPY